MKSIYCISPGYLNAMKEELKPYSFALQGYCDCDMAIANLMTTNFKDIIGFCLIADNLTEINIEDLKYFLELVDSVPLASKKTFVFTLRNRRGLEDFLGHLNLTRLRMRVLKPFELFTDVVIRGTVATFLVDKGNPYLTKKESKDLNTTIGNPLEYYPLFPPTFYECLSEVNIKHDLTSTLRYDKFLNFNNDSDDLYVQLRIAYIKSKFGVKVDLSDLEYEYRDSDNSFYVTLLSVISLIEDSYKEVENNENKAKTRDCS